MANEAEVPLIQDPAKDPQGLATFVRKVAMVLNTLMRKGQLVRARDPDIKGDTWSIVITLAGTVTSVGLTVPASIMSVSGSPVTTSGTLAVSLATQTANKVWAGPTTGAAATPTFRALVTADMPAGTGTVTSVAMTVPTSIMSVTGSPVTTTGTLAVSLATQTANLVWAGPTTGAAAAPTFRALVAADIPSLSYVPLTRTITAGTGLTGGGDLSADRTLTLANTAVTPGSYTSTDLTVDAQGRITAASSGSSGGGNSNIANHSLCGGL